MSVRTLVFKHNDGRDIAVASFFNLTKAVTASQKTRALPQRAIGQILLITNNFNQANVKPY